MSLDEPDIHDLEDGEDFGTTKNRVLLKGDATLNITRTLSEDSCLHLAESSHFSDYSSISWSTPMVDKDVPLDELFSAFVDCHQRQLNYIEKAGWDEETKLKEKVRVLESYVSQLEEQNDVLINTAAELERQTRKRVTIMEKRLQKSAKTTKEVVLHLHEYEEHFRNLVLEKSLLESNLEDSNHQSSTLKAENGLLRDHNDNLRHDLHALLHIIQQARSTGHWELDCVTFCELTPNQVYGPIKSFSPTPSGDSVVYPERSLDEERIVVASNLSQCDSVVSSSRGSLVNLDLGGHQKKEPVDLETTLNGMRTQICYLQKIREQAQLELLEKDGSIVNLESQLTSLNYEMSILKADCERRLLDSRVQGVKHNKQRLFENGVKQSSLPCICGGGSPTEEPANQQGSSTPRLTNGLQSSSLQSGNVDGSDSLSERSGKVSSASQTEIKSTTVLTQTDEPRKGQEVIVNGPVESMNKADVQQLREMLLRAQDKASAKEMLVSQLQSHLQVSAKEVELKDTTLVNVETKLEGSRQEVATLKGVIGQLEDQVLRLKEDIVTQEQLNQNLQINVNAREEMLKEMKEQEQSLQEQKRILMIQIDEQSEQLLKYQEELSAANFQLNLVSAEVELQKITIQNLQEGLVQMTRLSGKETNGPVPVNNNNRSNVARRALSQSSIYDI